MAIIWLRRRSCYSSSLPWRLNNWQPTWSFAFNPSDPYLYAADPLQLQVIRIDLSNGARQVIAGGPTLFDFPSSLGFLPTIGPVSELVVVSNQQERSPLTNDAVTQTTFNLPFVVAKILVLP